MKQTLSLFFLVPAFCGCIMAQDPIQQQYAAEIHPDSAKRHLSILASPEFEGRGTGEAGGERAAAYIAEEFKRLGLTGPVGGSYFQPINFVRTRFEVKSFVIEDQPYTNGKDFYFVGSGPEATIRTKEVVFIGYGISDANYDDLKGIDIKDKVVLVLAEGEPTDTKGNSIITGTDSLSEWSTSRTKRLQNITARSPKLIIA